MDTVASGFARIFRARNLFVLIALAFSVFTSHPAVAQDHEPAVTEADPVDDRALEAGRTAAVAALWETKHPADGPRWTEHTYELFRSYGQGLRNGVQDINSFCPKYNSLSDQQKFSFWTYLVSAITKYESGYDPTNRFRESSMGTDPITKQKVYSEGLLQLSYQDSLHYSFCDEFSWPADRTLAARDPRKTILDPIKNLNCGVRILIQQVNRKHLIGFGSGNYWSTLKTGSKHSQLANIQKLTKQISFCR